MLFVGSIKTFILKLVIFFPTYYTCVCEEFERFRYEGMGEEIIVIKTYHNVIMYRFVYHYSISITGGIYFISKRARVIFIPLPYTRRCRCNDRLEYHSTFTIITTVWHRLYKRLG